MKFELMYLPRWFGHTLGNAFRRVMLWYDMWGSITWISFKWYSHEYQNIDWVIESILDIVLNFKKLRFRLSESSDTVNFIKQTFSWVGKYYSKDINTTSWVEILDMDDYLFEITDPSINLEIEYRIEKWYGYYSLDYLKNRELQNEESNQDMILVDNDFRLIDYVKYDVKEIIDDFVWWSKDLMIIEIRTKYKWISPLDFLSFGAEVIASYCKLFIFEDAYIDRSMMIDYEDMVSSTKKVAQDWDVKTMPIDALPLSERTRNALIKNKILYVEDLEKRKKWELLLMKWVGRKAIDEINVALQDLGKELL